MTQTALHISREQVAELMGLEAAMPDIAWALIQEMSNGTSLDAFATAFKLDVETLIELRDYLTGKEGAESEAIWDRGLTAMRTTTVLASQETSGGWDSVEAMAVEKLSGLLSSMGGRGDPDTMLRIASAANRAIRRSRGEGPGARGGGSGNGSTQVNVGIAFNHGEDQTLKSGSLGTIKMNFSRSIQRQLGDSSRVITSMSDPERPQRDKVSEGLEMLRLSETRQLVEDQDGNGNIFDSRGLVPGKNNRFDFGDLIDAYDEVGPDAKPDE